MNRLFLACILALPIAGAFGQQNSLIHSVEFKALGPNDKKPQLLGDRFEYWDDDVNGQFYVQLDPPTNAPQRSLRITLKKDGEPSPIAETVQQNSVENKAHFLVRTSALKVGKYEVTASFADAAGGQIGEAQSFKFTRSGKRNPVVSIPADGIPIQLEAQSSFPDATWPVRAGVPMPINAVMDAGQLVLFENGKPVPAKITSLATWCPQGSVQWVHVDFLGKYNGGKPAEYQLKSGKNESTAGVKVSQTNNVITVDTGAIRFVVNQKKFAGIETAWFDPTATGKYDEANPVIQGAGGPYLVDGRIIRFDAANDTNVVVVVEEQGPTHVTIRAEGWYVGSEGRVDPFCKFVTRITAFAGQPFLRVRQHTIITYDTRMYRLKDLGFHIAATNSATFRLGADGATKEGALPASPNTVFLHQDRYDHFRVVGLGTNKVEGVKSDGWFTVGSSNAASPNMTVVLRDIWQKFPKEVEMSREGLTLHFWPKHGHSAFNLEDELDIKNIYKFWCFHQGELLNLHLPNDYFEKFNTDYADGTAECRPEHALQGNGQGLAIGNEFELLFTAVDKAADVPKHAQLFQRDPAAHATPEWNANSGALGRIAAVDRKNFTPMEEAIEKGWLSHTRCVERGNEYGMWIWPDTHTYWESEGDYAQLHRVWHNSHYHEIGQTWLMYFRSGSPDLLRWARNHTDHWMNIGTVNYTEINPNGRPKFKFHTEGAMYHCKGLTPWGAEDWGMTRRDSHAGLFGHWCDPDAFLWDWYMNGDPRAKDVYDLWTGSVRKYGAPLAGTRREANTSMATVMTYYAATHDADILPAVHGMGISLRTAEPLENQNPGPMWHPLWINRYYDQTRDPEYQPFILKYARMTSIENTWTTALASLAYELSGDKSYLTPHFEAVTDFPKKFYHAPGDAYDWYGVGPGPLGDNWGAYLCWGNFLYALKQAKITDLTPKENTRFSYLVGGFPRLTVIALKNKNQPITLTFSASSLGGDLHPCDIIFKAPSGKEVAKFRVPAAGTYPSRVTEKRELPPDGETGLYRFELHTHEANVGAPITDLPFEAMLVPKNADLEAKGVYGFLSPADETKTVELTIRSGGRHEAGTACNVILEDADGKVLVKDSLFAPRNRKSLTFTLDPTRHKLPWKIDVYGPTTILWKGESEQLFLAPSDQALKAIIGAMKRHSVQAEAK